MIQRILKILFFSFILFVFVFSSYELFFHKAEAAWLTCDWNKQCSSSSEECSLGITCHCEAALGGYICKFGSVPIE